MLGSKKDDFMQIMQIKEGKVFLVLTQPLSKVRIADRNGNHIRRPTVEAKNIKDNYIEWMITNDEIEQLINIFLNKKDRLNLIEKIKKINVFLKGSKFATRESIKTVHENLGKFMDFDIYKYTENFYSFEREVISKIKIRITFKMGDYTLAPHLYALIPFENPSVEIKNSYGKIPNGKVLGSGCKAEWIPKKEDLVDIITALSYASESHRDNLIDILNS